MKTLKLIASVTVSILGLHLTNAQITTSEVRVENTGNVTTISGNTGIGTTNPLNILHVQPANGNLNFSQAIRVRTNQGNFTTERGGGLIMQNADVITAGVFGIREFAWQGALAFYTHTASEENTFGSTFTEKMRLTYNGNLGIGVTVPENKLHVKIENGDLNFNQAVRVQTNEGNFTSGRGGGIIMQNSNVVTAGIFGVRQIGWQGALAFYTHDGAADNIFDSTFTEKMRINHNGNVGIGTTNPGYLLDVNGSLNAQSLYNSGQLQWADFVFHKNYKLPALSDVEAHIRANGHLKDIPSKKQVIESGYNLGDMDAKLLQKIEELTLYVIELNKKIETLAEENKTLKAEIRK